MEFVNTVQHVIVYCRKNGNRTKRLIDYINEVSTNIARDTSINNNQYGALLSAWIIPLTNVRRDLLNNNISDIEAIKEIERISTGINQMMENENYKNF